ncbi:hypothetical protein HYR54_08625 [Candidatus Acetothermia bacterium]|nr:hypothetical protein [Candidatus Acetothermia bacterium]
MVDSLLKACPQLRILASSREGLSIGGETLFAVSPLPLPQEHLEKEKLMQTPSVQLFVERAQAAKPSFQLTEENAEDVAEICRQLDGIPLALELAAARVKIMPPQKMVEYLDDRFRYLTGGARTAMAHHQTLRATIDWSYDLLEEEEKILLNRLSLFRGGFVLEATEGVCAGGALDELSVLEHLTQLVHKSLVQVDEEGEEARYRLLETVRQYAQEKLESRGEMESYRQAHGQYFLKLAVEAEPHLRGAEQAHWLNRLEREHENLRGALEWALGGRRGEEGLQLAGAMGRFWWIHGHLTEGREG